VAGVAGVRLSGSVPVGEAVLRGDALRGKEACRGASASRARDVAGEAGRKGGLAADEVADCLGGYGGKGGEIQPSSCGICLLLASTAARLLARVASMYVFALFLGGGAGCGDGDVGGDDAGSGDACGGDADDAG
jgi:hypothetical protein